MCRSGGPPPGTARWEGPIRSALMLAAAVHDGSEYALAIISMLALRSGWHRDQVEALLAGKDLGEEKTAARSASVSA